MKHLLSLTNKEIEEKIKYCLCNLMLTDSWGKAEGRPLMRLLLQCDAVLKYRENISRME